MAIRFVRVVAGVVFVTTEWILRLFEFVPLWGVKVLFRYRMRRVVCERCGVLVEAMVAYGLARCSLGGVRAIGVDEIHWRKGHRCLTVVYQLDEGCKRLLSVTQNRTVKSLLKFFRELGPKRGRLLKFIYSDLWKPYLKVIKKKAPQTLRILDRFHLVANLNKALDEIRVGEARKLLEEGYEEVLHHTKYCFLKQE